MTKTLMGAIVAIAASAVVSVVSAGQDQQGARAALRPATGDVQVLVPVSGTWKADYEKAGTKMIQVLTIDGTATAKAPDAEAARSLFAEKSAGFVAALAAPGAFPLAVARDIKEFSNGTLRVAFKLVSGATDQTAGILFGLQPDGSYTYARYNIKDGNVAIWKFENGARTVLLHGDVHEQLPLNQWHTLQVTIAGPAVSASVIGSKLAVRHTLPAAVQGRIGVWTKTDSVTSFKEFNVSGVHTAHTAVGAGGS